MYKCIGHRLNGGRSPKYDDSMHDKTPGPVKRISIERYLYIKKMEMEKKVRK